MSQNQQIPDSKIFVPLTKEVTIAGEVFTVKKFTLEKWIRISRELTGFASSVFLQLSKEKSVDGKMIVDDVAVADILPYIWTELHRVTPILALAIDKDAEWLKEQDDMEGIAALFATICELNNFKVIFENFTKGFRNLKNQWAEVKEQNSENS